MENESTHPQWMSDELVKDISPQKLEFLELLFQEGHDKTKKEMLPYMMRMLQKAKKEQLTLTPDEMNHAIAAIKKYSSPEEQKKMDDIIEKSRQGSQK